MLRLTNPPRNFLGPVLRADLDAALTDLAQDPTVAGVLLTGSEGMFSTGYNAASPDMRDGDPSLRAICHRIEALPKPVVASLFGAALGAGLELALAAHGRVALRTARVGMPDIAVGLIPSAGGTQRLARLLGADRALALMLSGQALPVTHPRVAGLLDETVVEGVEKAGIALLKRMILGTAPIRVTSDRGEGLADPQGYQRAVQACRAALGDDAPVPEARLIDCVERALLLPFAAGEDFEQVAFEEAATSDQAQGLLHVQLALRRAPNMPEALKAKPLPVSALGVIGGGPAAAALVQGALKAGLNVTWFERSAQAAQTARDRLDRLFEAAQEDPETRRACLTQLGETQDLRDLARADLVIDAVADHPRTKAQLFAALDKVLPAATVLLTQTATQEIAPIALASGRVGQVVGMQALAGSGAARLAEVIPGPASSAAATVTAADCLRRIGYVPVRCGSGGGTIGLRMICALRDAADYLLARGASPAQVDADLAAYGLTGGVFGVLDSQGLEPVLRRAGQLHQRGRYALHHLARIQALVAQGRTGRASGAGFYDWDGDRPVPRPDDTVASSALPRSSILPLCLGAMMNEGARLLREDVALRPSDIDLVMIRHYGFPAWRGGPMNAADRTGLFTLVRAMKPHADDAPRLFGADEGIAALIRNGEKLEVLNTVGRGRRRIAGA